jgi:hypothetical protein
MYTIVRTAVVRIVDRFIIIISSVTYCTVVVVRVNGTEEEDRGGGHGELRWVDDSDSHSIARDSVHLAVTKLL